MQKLAKKHVSTSQWLQLFIFWKYTTIYCWWKRNWMRLINQARNRTIYWSEGHCENRFSWTSWWDRITQHLSDKIKGNVDQIVIDPRVKCKVIVGSRNFMSKLDVKECMALLNPKKSESFVDFRCVPSMTHVIPCLNPCLPCSVTFTKPKKFWNSGRLLKLSPSSRRAVRIKLRINDQLQIYVLLQKLSKNNF